MSLSLRTLLWWLLCKASWAVLLVRAVGTSSPCQLQLRKGKKSTFRHFVFLRVMRSVAKRNPVRSEFRTLWPDTVKLSGSGSGSDHQCSGAGAALFGRSREKRGGSSSTAQAPALNLCLKKRNKQNCQEKCKIKLICLFKYSTGIAKQSSRTFL